MYDAMSYDIKRRTRQIETCREKQRRLYDDQVHVDDPVESVNNTIVRMRKQVILTERLTTLIRKLRVASIYAEVYGEMLIKYNQIYIEILKAF